MFDQLYKAQRARERHFNAPLTDERIRYLSHWATQGSTRSSLRVRAQDLLTFIDYLHLETADEIDEEQINKAADRWAKRQPQPPNVIDFRYGKLRFISHARQWIAFLGRLRQPEVPRPSYTHMIEEFSEYMREEKGLSPVTVHKRRQHVTQFLSRFDEQHRPFNEISILDIDAAIARKGEHDAYTRSSIRTYASALELSSITLSSAVGALQVLRRRLCRHAFSPTNSYLKAHRGKTCSACWRVPKGTTQPTSGIVLS